MENQIYKDIVYHLLNDEKPSQYLLAIKDKLKDGIFNELYELNFTEQEKQYHPEGVVWNHVMMVVDMAAKLKKYAIDKEEFMVAALLHDIGKVKTTKRNNKGRLISYNHDKIGAEEARVILGLCDLQEEKINKIVSLIGYHMHHLYISKNLPFANVPDMLKEVTLRDMVLLFLCDRLGRGENLDEIIINKKEIEEILNVLDTLNRQYNVDIDEFKEILSKIK